MPSIPRTRNRRLRRQALAPMRAVPALRGGDPRRLAELASEVDVVRLPPGRTLARAGGTARELIAIVAGEAAVLGPGGPARVLRAGAQIGLRELLGDAPHAATVVTTSEVEAVIVNGPGLRWAQAEGLVAAPVSAPVGVPVVVPVAGTRVAPAHAPDQPHRLAG